MKRMTAFVAAVTAGAGLMVGMGSASAGESSAEGLTPYHHQRPLWKACQHSDLDAAGAQCADVRVPLDYARPRGRSITVAISRIKATDPAKRRGVMLSNPGGPGGSGLDLMVMVRKAMTADVQARYDLIGLDPRGIGRSTPVDCGWPVGTMLRSAGVDRAAFDRTVVVQADLARRCAATEGEYLRHVSTRNTARDMDVVRAVLGEQRISYFGWSYGTYLGAVYTQMFPARSDRFVLDSAADPADWFTGTMAAMAAPNEAALDDWSTWAATRDGEFHLGTTGRQVRSLVEGLVRRAAREPIRIGEYRVDQHVLPMVLFVRFDSARNDVALAGDIRQLVDAADGKTVTPNPGLEQILRVFYRPTAQTQNSAQAAVVCGDSSAPRDPEWYWRGIHRVRATYPVFGSFTHSLTACAFWAPPAEPKTVVRNSVPALIVQATGDTRTSYDGGVRLHRAMTGSRLVTLQDVRIHAIFGNYPNRCVEDTVNTYFRDGTLPRADTTCHDD
ncbi:alpha/beta hydrolase [Actinokineospora cianjurensis]|uniref:Alpha/beta hydrolase family protein n=1 Tax=Actinokineospora cianjurensis TaxID=585224 RepID=A0A421B424_9PSEU|nr:alpha/beta hydrolase [Actinokineospora cianjurensis]RLK59040.1 alpha/beta hydrolase family protein [Actinokineospora cianjurensis]